MTPSSAKVRIEGMLPTTLKLCKICQQQTPHEIRTGGASKILVCVPCLRRALAYELERD